MKSKIVLFGFCLFIWIGLNWPIDLIWFLVGIAVSAGVAFVTGDMFVHRPQIVTHLERYLWFLYFFPIFIFEVIKANIDVAYRVSHPDLPINPGIVKVKTTIKSGTGLTLLANSITLTPGTFAVDVDVDKGYLYIHWIDVKSQDVDAATELIVKTFENILKKIFE